jgi:protein phosphatase
MWNGGFNAELESLYPGQGASSLFAETFSVMPLGAIVNQTMICLHGGIGPSTQSVSTIKNMYRPVHTFEEEAISDLLWSDPCSDIDEFMPSSRGTGHKYGEVALTNFLQSNGLSVLIRGHECVDSGFEYSLGRKVGTVFSASSYCNVMENSAAVLLVYKDDKPPMPHYFQPIKYIMRGSAIFLPSENETTFSVDQGKMRKSVPKLPFLPASKVGRGIEQSKTQPRLPVSATFESIPGFRAMDEDVEKRRAEAPDEVSKSSLFTEIRAPRARSGSLRVKTPVPKPGGLRKSYA